MGLEGNGVLDLLGTGVLALENDKLGEVGRGGTIALRGNRNLGVLGKRIPGVGCDRLFGVLGAGTLILVCGRYLEI